MGTAKKSWTDKLHDAKDLPRVEHVEGRMAGKAGDALMVIPAPIEVDEMMSRVPAGMVTTVNEIRAALAGRHGATTACPLCTGLFAGIAARAAEEQRAGGRADITPYWRTLKAGGFLNEKFPGGMEGQRRLLEAEGHKVIARGKRYAVAAFERALFSCTQIERASK